MKEESQSSSLILDDHSSYNIKVFILRGNGETTEKDNIAKFIIVSMVYKIETLNRTNSTVNDTYVAKYLHTRETEKLVKTKEYFTLEFVCE